MINPKLLALTLSLAQPALAAPVAIECRDFEGKLRAAAELSVASELVQGGLTLKAYQRSLKRLQPKLKSYALDLRGWSSFDERYTGTNDAELTLAGAESPPSKDLGVENPAFDLTLEHEITPSGEPDFGGEGAALTVVNFIRVGFRTRAAPVVSIAKGEELLGRVETTGEAAGEAISVLCRVR